MKILVDSDWILELLVNRHQYAQEAEKLLTMLNKRSPAQIYITELCLDKINSFLGKEDSQLVQDAVLWVKNLVNNRILPFSNDVRDYASNLPIKDFESAVEVAIARKENIGAIITLNPEIFTGANLPVLSSGSFLERVQFEQIFSKNNSAVLVEGNLQTIEKLNKLLQVKTPISGNLAVTKNSGTLLNMIINVNGKICFEKELHFDIDLSDKDVDFIVKKIKNTITEDDTSIKSVTYKIASD